MLLYYFPEYYDLNKYLFLRMLDIHNLKKWDTIFISLPMIKEYLLYTYEDISHLEINQKLEGIDSKFHVPYI